MGQIYGANPYALYHLADLTDSSGNFRNLTQAGTINFGPGRFATCADLGNPNEGNYFKRPDLLGLPDLYSTSFTVLGWFKAHGIPPDYEEWTLIDFRIGSSVATKNVLSCSISYWPGWSSTTMGVMYGSMGSSGKAGFLPEEFTSFGLVLDSSMPKATVYCNGRRIVSTTGADGTWPLPTGTALGATTFEAYHLCGCLEEVAILPGAWNDQSIRRWHAWTRGKFL